MRVLQRLFWLLLLSHAMLAQAQHTVSFQVAKKPTGNFAADSIFIAGSFNNWKPDSAAFGFTSTRFSLTLPSGSYEYKFTRGGWQKGETTKEGAARSNRQLTIEGDTTIQVEIEGWADQIFQTPIHSTASSNVHVIDTAFYMPQLHRYRRIWICLPEGYNRSHKKYGVLYMQDGQNVFDDATAFSGEWGVDEALDTLALKTGECIVVAIDHGGEKRLNEYAPFDMEQYGRGEGNAYVDFLVKTLRPYIQKHYRVKKGRKHQAIAGSSMGGLISFYALLKYPKKFGVAGVFSPSFWIAPQLRDVIVAKGKHVRGRIYFYAGKDESESMVPDLLAVFGQMQRVSKAKMTTVIRTGGQHNERRWRQEFPLFYTWLMTR